MKKRTISSSLVLATLPLLVAACGGEEKVATTTHQIACRTYLVTVAGADTSATKTLVDATAVGDGEFPSVDAQVKTVKQAAKDAALVPGLSDADFKAFVKVSEDLERLFPSGESSSTDFEGDIRVLDTDVRALRERCHAS